MSSQKTIALTRTERVKIEVRADELSVTVSAYCRAMLLRALRDRATFNAACAAFRHPNGRKMGANGKPLNTRNRHEPSDERFSVTIEDEAWSELKEWSRLETLPRGVAIRAILAEALDREVKIEAIQAVEPVRPVGQAYKCRVPRALVERYEALAPGVRLSKDALDNITGYTFASIEARQLRGSRDEQRAYNSKLFGAIEAISFLYFGIGSESGDLAGRDPKPASPMVDFVVVDKSGRGEAMTKRLGCEGMAVDLMVSLVASVSLWLVTNRIKDGKGLV